MRNWPQRKRPSTREQTNGPVSIHLAQSGSRLKGASVGAHRRSRSHTRPSQQEGRGKGHAPVMPTARAPGQAEPWVEHQPWWLRPGRGGTSEHLCCGAQVTPAGAWERILLPSNYSSKPSTSVYALSLRLSPAQPDQPGPGCRLAPQACFPPTGHCLAHRCPSKEGGRESCMADSQEGRWARASLLGLSVGCRCLCTGAATPLSSAPRSLWGQEERCRGDPIVAL